ncbi:MAG: hypothetical protein HN742_31545 [Lentisphaerae bacterium]|jgi:bifunctional DNase/RNase|nr:hypothetical protein [Lentisphaerota bacterium]MBT4821940.1 hypothetical protein [Lentisphaerota bacterium]MBT5612627.1 hypothetical protein [Lentisphaerota bacterium]MBT7057951.1 hypothetical protein [Lentisphaerota bacterium]MBT7846446.1 hypothetical protein [Lentisphaerota bacterium]
MAKSKDPHTVRINSIRISLGKQAANLVMLTGEQQRSFFVGVSEDEALVLDPFYRRGVEALEPLDIRRVLTQTLSLFGCRIVEAIIHGHRGVEFITTMDVTGLNGTVSISCNIDDAVPLAVASGATLRIDEELITAMMIRRKDDEPCTPRGAWRSVRRHSRETEARDSRTFATLDDVFQAIEAEPGNTEARSALRQAAWPPDVGLPARMVTVKDRSGGMAAVKAWVERCRGTEHELTATALAGAVFLWSDQPEEALPYLEQACELTPEYVRPATDLARAYALTGRKDDAFRLLRNHPKLKTCSYITNYGNLRDLWDDPRYEEIVGKPNEHMRYVLDLPQFLTILFGSSHQEDGSSPEDPFIVELTTPAPQSINIVASALPTHEFVCAKRLRFASRITSRLETLQVETSAGAVSLPISVSNSDTMLWPGVGLIEEPEGSLPGTVGDALEAAGLNLVAAVLPNPHGDGERETGALVIHAEDRTELVRVHTMHAIAIAAAAKRPLFVSLDSVLKIG